MTPAQRLAVAACTIALLAGCATAPPTADTPSVVASRHVVPAVAVAVPTAVVDESRATAAAAADTGAATAATAKAASAAAAAAVAPMADPATESRAAVVLAQTRRFMRTNVAYGERDNLWQRLRDGFAMTASDNSELVAKWEQWYGSRPDYVARMTERGGRYLFHIVEEVQRRELPTELALLPFIESAFNPQAMSTARASGMWQFMPATGRDFELKQNLFRDDRRDVLASTRAALDYLQKLQRMFGDWQLALAAYNWGQGNVQKAIVRNQKAGLPTDYASLRMPDETRNYLPKLQAVKNLVARPEAFAITLPPLENHPFFSTVPIVRDIDVALAARLAGITLDEFRQLNPQLNKPVILAAGTPQVLLPYDNAEQFRHALAAHAGPTASWSAWVAPHTLRPAEAARKIGMPEAQLREVNVIPPHMVVKAGSTLMVPRDADATADVAGHVADNAAMVLGPDGPPPRRVVIKAGKRGETVAAVALRYRVSAALVAQWNDVDLKSAFKAGQAIVLMLPSKPPAKATTRRNAQPRSTRPRATRR